MTGNYEPDLGSVVRDADAFSMAIYDVVEYKRLGHFQLNSMRVSRQVLIPGDSYILAPQASRAV